MEAEAPGEAGIDIDTDAPPGVCRATRAEWTWVVRGDAASCCRARSTALRFARPSRLSPGNSRSQSAQDCQRIDGAALHFDCMLPSDAPRSSDVDALAPAAPANLSALMRLLRTDR